MIYRLIGAWFAVLVMTVLPASAQKDLDRQARLASLAMDSAFDGGWARAFMQAFPKGGDVHNHLQGAIYAETWLEWAAEDGYCIDLEKPAIVEAPGGRGTECAAPLTSVEAVLNNAIWRDRLIDGLSIRDFVPYAGWSGSDQFFDSFFRMANRPERFGDMLARVADRAGRQNILYLELMHTIILPELFPLVAGAEMTGDAGTDYRALMAGDFGAARGDLAAHISGEIDKAFAKKDALLNCGTDTASPGCDVKITFLHQVVREFPRAHVHAQIALGWDVMAKDPRVVGLNLVAPEHGFRALRDYRYHMAVIDHLYQTEGAQNVTLHAGELAIGQVRPENLRFHIRSAIEDGHALRIGHGTAIAYEDDSDGLLNLMRDRGIPVEINITSSEAILGITGSDHAYHLYRLYDVPVIFSTDDEGVGRLDLTSEYMRAVRDFGVSYFDLKQSSRNSLAYSFLPGGSLYRNAGCMAALLAGSVPEGACLDLVNTSEKAALEWTLEQRFRAFEKTVMVPADRQPARH